MEWENETSVTEFVFLAFADIPEMHLLLFVVLFLLYVITLIENTVLLAVITADPRLHTPMYFFLWNLSFLEVCQSFTVIPKLLINFLSEHKTISFAGCAAQMFFHIIFGSSGIFLVVIMSYDRYVAVCNPLRYKTIMTETYCVKLLSVAFIFGFLVSLRDTVLVFHLPYCGSNKIHHFYCDIRELLMLTLTCTDTYIYSEVIKYLSVILFTLPVLMIFISYVCIIAAILRIRTTEGRRKAFSSCSSHLTFVILQYTCLSFMYLQPKSTFSWDNNKLFVMAFMFGNPILTPIIYSVRNKDVKNAFKRLIIEKQTSRIT